MKLKGNGNNHAHTHVPTNTHSSVCLRLRAQCGGIKQLQTQQWVILAVVHIKQALVGIPGRWTVLTWPQLSKSANATLTNDRVDLHTVNWGEKEPNKQRAHLSLHGRCSSLQTNLWHRELTASHYTHNIWYIFKSIFRYWKKKGSACSKFHSE